MTVASEFCELLTNDQLERLRRIHVLRQEVLTDWCGLEAEITQMRPNPAYSAAVQFSLNYIHIIDNVLRKREFLQESGAKH